MIAGAWHILAILGLTALTQVGGLSWLVALLARGWRRYLLFFGAYAVLSTAAGIAAPVFGRERLPCFTDAEVPLASASPVYCAMNRSYVTPQTRRMLEALARDMAHRHPGTVTLTLDGSFPFTRMPLLPHLSHRDGRRDLAFQYTDADGSYLSAATRSPLGYFAFEPSSEPETCPHHLVSLRWDLAWLQPLWPDLPLDRDRTVAMVRWLTGEGRSHGVVRVVLEPHLVRSLGVADPMIRFQGCNAARHDDHLHVEVAE